MKKRRFRWNQKPDSGTFLQEKTMHADQIQITLSRDKLHEIVTAYNVLSNFLDSVFPRELLYKKPFLQGLDSALKEVKSRQSQKVQSFDEFTK